MPNIYLKPAVEKNLHSQNFGFLSLKNLSPGQFLNFKISCWNLKIRGLGAKLCVAFFIILILKGIMTF